MDEVTRQDMTINGAGTVGGGSFRDIAINGSGVINGDVDCRRLTINGQGSVNGTVTAGTIAIHGSGTLRGVRQADLLEIHGEGTVQEDVGVKALRVNGAASFHGGITAETVEMHGAITVEQDCTSERFTAHGGFVIGGLLNADTIDITLHGTCRAREIGGSTIRVAPATHGLASLNKLFHALLNHTHGLTADLIEGDEIRLEHTIAKVVRGKRITLGAGCAIDMVEYTESFEAATGAKVKEQAKVGS